MVDEDRKNQIEAAAEKAEVARRIYESSLAANVPQDYNRRMEAAKAHAIAEAEWCDAENELRRIIGNKPT